MNREFSFFFPGIIMVLITLTPGLAYRIFLSLPFLATSQVEKPSTLSSPAASQKQKPQTLRIVLQGDKLRIFREKSEL